MKVTFVVKRHFRWLDYKAIILFCICIAAKIINKHNSARLKIWLFENVKARLKSNAHMLVERKTKTNSKPSCPGFEKRRNNFSLRAWKNLLLVGRNVLYLMVTISKNKYRILNLKNCSLFICSRILPCFRLRFTNVYL